MYNIQLDASSGREDKTSGKQMRSTLKERNGARIKGIAQRTAKDEIWEIPQPSVVFRSWKRILNSKRLAHEVYSSTLVTLTVVTILLLVTLARHLCANSVGF